MFASADSEHDERESFMGSLHMTRARLLAAYLNRWRRKLDPIPRLLLRPKLFLLLDIRRRNTLHKFITAWGLLMHQLVTDRRIARRRGVRILRLLSGREAKLRTAGMERWKDTVRAARALDRRKEASFERWKLFVLLSRHNPGWGVERAMRLLRRMWLQRLVFDYLRSWRTARLAARVIRDALAAALVHDAWVSWHVVVERENRDRTIRRVWSSLMANLEGARRKNSIASAHCRVNLLNKIILLWLEASKRGRSLRKAFERWARQLALVKREKDAAAAALLLRLCSALALDLQRQALIRWKEDVLEAKEADTVVSLPPQKHPITCLSPRPSSICRAIVVTESRCDVNGHLELQLRSARRTLDKALGRAGADVTLREAGHAHHRHLDRSKKALKL
eukprot:g12695.t1